MAISFDFNNGGASVSTFDTGAFSLSNTDGGVQFTVSTDAAGGTAFIKFPNAAGPGIGISMVDGGPDDIFTLVFQSTGAPAANALLGNTADPVRLFWGQQSGTWKVTWLTAGGSITIPGFSITESNDFGTLTLTQTGVAVTGVRFTSTDDMFTSSRFQLLSMSAAGFACFCGGTRIATPDGPVEVERLRPGAMLLTAGGTPTRARWIGQSCVPDPALRPSHAPVRIRRGALGQGLPRRDLCLSPDHAIALDGALVNASALVNGTTITRDRRSDPFTYFHVETDAHELILAEGVPAETYLEHLAPQEFDNARTREPRVVPEMDLPRITSARMLMAAG